MISDEIHIEDDGRTCPGCGSGNTQSIGDALATYDEAFEPMHCTNCEGYWDNVFKLTGYKNFIKY